MKIYKLLFILCISIGCKSLNISNKEPFPTEKFDTAKFNKHKIANRAIYLREDGAKITQSGVSEFYSEQVRIDPDKPFAWSYTFFKESLKLRSAAEFFYGFPVGKYHEYNESGVLVKEIDNEAPFHFSLDDVILKMENDYNINVLSLKNGLIVERYVDDVTKEPTYVINIPVSAMAVRHIVIDGNSGAVKKDAIGQLTE